MIVIFEGCYPTRGVDSVMRARLGETGRAWRTCEQGRADDGVAVGGRLCGAEPYSDGKCQKPGGSQDGLGRNRYESASA